MYSCRTAVHHNRGHRSLCYPVRTSCEKGEEDEGIINHAGSMTVATADLIGTLDPLRIEESVISYYFVADDPGVRRNVVIWSDVLSPGKYRGDEWVIYGRHPESKNRDD